MNRTDKKKESDKRYRENNKEKIKQSNKKYVENNRERVLKKGKLYRQKNKEKAREYYLTVTKPKNGDDDYKKRQAEKAKIRRSENLERSRSVERQWYKKNRENVLKRKNAYNKTEKRTEYRRKYENKRYHADINYKIAKRLRSRLRKVLKKDSKKGSHVKLLGCSVEFLKSHLESLFQPGMTWDNYGFGYDKWCIDHIIPLNYFDLQDVQQLEKACHYTNLQPLWCSDNFSKGDKYDTVPVL